MATAGLVIRGASVYAALRAIELGVWMRLKVAAICIGLSAMPICAAAGTRGYIGNYAQWIQASPEVRRGYVMGVFDTFLIEPTEAASVQDRSDMARALGLFDCVKVKQLSDFDLMSMTEITYKTHPDMRQYGPSVVLGQALGDTCHATINARRKAYGLPMLTQEDAD